MRVGGAFSNSFAVHVLSALQTRSDVAVDGVRINSSAVQFLTAVQLVSDVSVGGRDANDVDGGHCDTGEHVRSDVAVGAALWKEIPSTHWVVFWQTRFEVAVPSRATNWLASHAVYAPHGSVNEGALEKVPGGQSAHTLMALPPPTRVGYLPAGQGARLMQAVMLWPLGALR